MYRHAWSTINPRLWTTGMVTTIRLTSRPDVAARIFGGRPFALRFSEPVTGSCAALAALPLAVAELCAARAASVDQVFEGQAGLPPLVDGTSWLGPELPGPAERWPRAWSWDRQKGFCGARLHECQRPPERAGPGQRRREPMLRRTPELARSSLPPKRRCELVGVPPRSADRLSGTRVDMTTDWS